MSADGHEAGAVTVAAVAPDDVQARIVDDLGRDGVALARYDELFDRPTFAELQLEIEPFVRSAEERAREAGPVPRKKNDVIVRRFLDKSEGAEKPVLTLDNVWLQLGASERMLEIVNAYRAEPTRIHYVDNWFTIPFAAAETRVGSQRWHRDPEEEHVVKAFLYLSDVDEGAGPFEYVRGSFAGGRYGHLWPWGEEERYPSEEELEAAIDPGDRLTLAGPAGTMVFCDTGGFHRGGFARTKPRILATWSYVSMEKKGRKFKLALDQSEAALPEHVRAALS